MCWFILVVCGELGARDAVKQVPAPWSSRQSEDSYHKPSGGAGRQGRFLKMEVNPQCEEEGRSAPDQGHKGFAWLGPAGRGEGRAVRRP